jgi:hypothetical protein
VRSNRIVALYPTLGHEHANITEALELLERGQLNVNMVDLY